MGQRSIILLLALLFAGLANADQRAGARVFVMVFDSGAGSNHSQKVMSTIKKEARGCASCRYFEFPLYDQSGRMYRSMFLESLGKAAALLKKEEFNPSNEVAIYHFSWNHLEHVLYEEVQEKLREAIDSGVMLVAAAGRSRTKGRKVLKLSETVMGQIEGAYIIGEKLSGGSLDPLSNYGPEMFSAISSPKGLNGYSFSAARFTGRLALETSKTNSLPGFKKLLNSKKGKKSLIEIF